MTRRRVVSKARLDLIKAKLYINQEELADIRGVGLDRIRQDCREGMPHYREASGRGVRFKLAEVEAWLAEHRRIANGKASAASIEDVQIYGNPPRQKERGKK